jgi:hypothetical protein
VDCNEPVHELGYLVALECAVKKVVASRMVRTLLKFGQCALGLVSFFAPEAKVLGLVKDAGAASSAAELAKQVGTATPPAQVVMDLKQISETGVVSWQHGGVDTRLWDLSLPRPRCLTLTTLDVLRRRHYSCRHEATGPTPPEGSSRRHVMVRLRGLSPP